jgi:hypothetical protein
MWRSVLRREGRRRFFDDVRELVERLHAHREFVRRLVSTGGRAELIVNLAGDVNIGATMKADTLRTLADLGIDFGIEVFPGMD